MQKDAIRFWIAPDGMVSLCEQRFEVFGDAFVLAGADHQVRLRFDEVAAVCNAHAGTRPCDHIEVERVVADGGDFALFDAEHCGEPFEADSGAQAL